MRERTKNLDIPEVLELGSLMPVIRMVQFYRVNFKRLTNDLVIKGISAPGSTRARATLEIPFSVSTKAVPSRAHSCSRTLDTLQMDGIVQM